MALSLTFYKRLSAALTSIPLFLHIFGLTMIYKTSRSSGGKRQYTTTFYFLISLSICEIIHLLLIVITNFITFESKLWLYLSSYQTGTNTVQLLFTFVFMTSERFLRIYLGLKYPFYWNSTSTKRLLIGTFIILNAVSVPFYIFAPRMAIYYTFAYIFPFLEALF